jgi:hypothetical protein
MATKGIRPSLVTSSLSSSVTACRDGAGSTTAAGKARHRPGEGYQGRQNTLPSQPQRKHNTSLHHIPRTAYVLANHQPHTPSKNHGVLKLKTIPRGEDPVHHSSSRRCRQQKLTRRRRASRSRTRRRRAS